MAVLRSPTCRPRLHNLRPRQARRASRNRTGGVACSAQAIDRRGLEPSVAGSQGPPRHHRGAVARRKDPTLSSSAVVASHAYQTLLDQARRTVSLDAVVQLFVAVTEGPGAGRIVFISRWHHPAQETVDCLVRTPSVPPSATDLGRLEQAAQEPVFSAMLERWPR
jgi:hypothetical protein